MNKNFYIYILASKRKGTLYVGVTANLLQRVWQNKEGLVDGFSKKYDVKKLVYYEQHDNATSAIHREKQLKEWRRALKINLIEEFNPNWNDLYGDIVC
jgi:putative endonuclease